jgi:transcriptional regulator with XRE-family HTH domain
VAENNGPVVESLTQRVASNLRAELGRRQQSQGDLGLILGIHRTQISKRLKGEELSFTTAELDQIAGAWGIPVDRLIGSPMAVAA